MRAVSLRRIRWHHMVVAVLLVYLGVVGIRGEILLWRLGRQEAALAREVAAERARQRELLARLAGLHNPLRLEGLIGQELGMVPRGQVPVLYVRPGRLDTSAPRQ